MSENVKVRWWCTSGINSWLTTSDGGDDFGDAPDWFDVPADLWASYCAAKTEVYELENALVEHETPSRSTTPKDEAEKEK